MATTQSNVLFLRPREVARALRLSLAQLNRWRMEGAGPRFVQLGRSVVYWRVDVAVFEIRGAKTSSAISSDSETS